MIRIVLGKNNADVDSNNNFEEKLNSNYQNKSIEEKNKPFEKAFSLDDLEEIEEDDLNMKYYFKINDFNNYLNVHNFMNNLVCELEINGFEKDDEKMEIKIIPSKNEYQMDIIFKNKELKITE